MLDGSLMGYQLNIQLREGERLTRNWFNQGTVIDWTDADIVAGGEHVLGRPLARTTGWTGRTSVTFKPAASTCLI